MTNGGLLHEFVSLNRDEIIRRCKSRVATRPHGSARESEANFGVPLFLDQLVSRLRNPAESGGAITASAAQHGHDLLMRGFSVSQVVHDYGDVCQTITNLAVETNAPITTEEFRLLNESLDTAIAGAVTVYGRESEQSYRDGYTRDGNERLGFFTHELRNLVNTALLAFEVLKTGNVGVVGSTGAVIHRSLMGLRHLIARSAEEVRLTHGIQHPTRIDVADFIREVSHAAALEAANRGVTLVVPPVERGLEIQVDPQLLAAVMVNLLQNAFKFTRPHTTVTMRAGASADRVLIQVQDECGGLPGEVDPENLFRPFEQRGADRSGMGIGLAFSRWGTEAHGGRLYGRSLPNEGCVFTVDLPRLAAAEATPDQGQA